MTNAHAPLPRLLHCGPWVRLPMQLLSLMVAAQRLSRERQQLAEMDAAQLKDVGLTAADCMAELGKPVWRR